MDICDGVQKFEKEGKEAEEKQSYRRYTLVYKKVVRINMLYI